MVQSPYQDNKSKAEHAWRLNSFIDVLADVIVHGVFRKKRPSLHFDISQADLQSLLDASQQELQELKAQREICRKQYVLRKRILLVALPLLLLGLPFIGLGAISLMFIAFVLGGCWMVSASLPYRKYFDQQFLPALLARLPNYEYMRNGYIPVTELKSSGIIPDHVDSLTRQEDYLHRWHDDVYCELVECEFKEYRRDKNGVKESPVFKGVISRLTMPNRISKRIVMQANWGKLLSLLQKKPMDKSFGYKLDEPRLAKKYDFYCEDKTYLESTISTAFQAKLADFIDKLDVAAPEFSFYENYALLLLHRPQNFLSAPALNEPLDQQKLLTELLQEIQMMNEFESLALEVWPI